MVWWIFFSSARDQTCKLWYKSIIPRKFINIHVYGQQCFWCIFLQIGNYLSENHGKWRKIDSLLEKVKCALLCDGSSTCWKFNSPRYSSILSLFFSETKISQILKLGQNYILYIIDVSNVVMKHLKSKTFRHRKEQFQCDKCEYKSAFKQSLKLHVVSNHGGKQFTCDGCNYNYIK